MSTLQKKPEITLSNVKVPVVSMPHASTKGTTVRSWNRTTKLIMSNAKCLLELGSSTHGDIFRVLLSWSTDVVVKWDRPVIVRLRRFMEPFGTSMLAIRTKSLGSSVVGQFVGSVAATNVDGPSSGDEEATVLDVLSCSSTTSVLRFDHIGAIAAPGECAACNLPACIDPRSVKALICEFTPSETWLVVSDFAPSPEGAETSMSTISSPLARAIFQR
mmetsp:Transcript_25459/g.58681  ORF Transcript_25459/g.58681 Transcript_25459/m.58681 type:complete len:217 (-) Transcript_25459:421-1071(-)